MLYLPEVFKEKSIQREIHPSLQEIQQEEEIIFMDDIKVRETFEP